MENVTRNIPLQILPDTDPILRLIAEEVTVFDHELKTLINKMLMTMDTNYGVGLAAPQVGKSIRVMVMRCPRAFYYVNPIILEKSPLLDCMNEGCLSLLGKAYSVSRPIWIKIRYQDERGTFHEEKIHNFHARVFLHEYDHLNGILISDVGTRIT